MEIYGKSDSGEVVKASAIDFAKENAMDGETYSGVGQSPLHARYSRKDAQGNIQYREVDLREMATQGGLTDVGFNFDKNAAKNVGLYHEGEVDSSVAYNLERIRGSEGKRKYLADKGYKGVFNDGDDFYSCENGVIRALNNKDGLDFSDVARWAAGAGKEIGAAAGAIATGVGAAATGGMALPLVAAGSALGAVGGEVAQRLGDKILGADAEKYQKYATGSEEFKAMASTAGEGALMGVVGQGINKVAGLAWKGATAVTADAMKATGAKAATEFTQKVAAKAEAGYLRSLMPQGWGAGGALSAEEASAKAILNQTIRPDADAAAMRKGVNEAKEQLASGRLKKVVEDPQEFTRQGMLRNVVKQKAAAEEAQEMAKKRASEASKALTEQRRGENIQNEIINAQEVLGNKYGEQVEKIFSAKSDIHEANKLAVEVEDDFLEGLNAELSSAGTKSKLKISRGNDGRTLIDEDALAKFSGEIAEKQCSSVEQYAASMANKGFEFAKAPSDKERAMFGSTLKGVLKEVDDMASSIPMNEYKQIKGLLKAVEAPIAKHNEITHDNASWALNKLVNELPSLIESKNLPASTRRMLRNMNEMAFSYAKDSSKFPMALDQAQGLFSKSLKLRSDLASPIHSGASDLSDFVNTMTEMSVMNGDKSAMVSSRLASLYHLKAKADGDSELASKMFKLMNDTDKAQFRAIDSVKNHQLLVKKSVVPKEEEGSFIKNQLVAGGIGTMATMAGMTIGAPAALAVGAVATLATSKTARKATAESLKSAGSVMAKAATSHPARVYAGQKAASRAATSAEEYMAKKLQKFTESGDNG